VHDEGQGIQAVECHGVEVQEVCGNDVVGLGGEELTPGGAGALWRGVNSRGMQDLPDRGRGDGVAEAEEFALYASVAQVLFSLAKRRMRCLTVDVVGGSPGWRC
jgi:hypothetical protein